MPAVYWANGVTPGIRGGGMGEKERNKCSEWKGDWLVGRWLHEGDLVFRSFYLTMEPYSLMNNVLLIKLFDNTPIKFIF